MYYFRIAVFLIRKMDEDKHTQHIKLAIWLTGNACSLNGGKEKGHEFPSRVAVTVFPSSYRFETTYERLLSGWGRCACQCLTILRPL